MRCIELHRSKLMVRKNPQGGRENKAWLLEDSMKRYVLHLPGRREKWPRNCSTLGQTQLSRTWLWDGSVRLGNTIDFMGVVGALSRSPECTIKFKLVCGLKHNWLFHYILVSSCLLCVHSSKYIGNACFEDWICLALTCGVHICKHLEWWLEDSMLSINVWLLLLFCDIQALSSCVHSLFHSIFQQHWLREGQ